MADVEPSEPGLLGRLTQPGGMFAPFRYSSFRMIWLANLSSALGSAIQSVAAAWLMTSLTTSHFLIATVQASTLLPIMMFGVFAGAIADNFERRRVMLAAQTVMLAAAAVLAAVNLSHAMTPALLLALTLTIGTGTAVNSPAWQASVRQQVGTRDLPQAISLNSIGFNLARSVGPALGGLLISLWSASAAFVVYGCCVSVMIATLLRWRPRADPPVRKPILPAIAIGIRFCAGSSPLRRILLRGLFMGFGMAGYQALVPAVVHDRLHGSEIDYGLLLCLFGMGSILAALFVTSARRRWGVERVLTAAAFAFIVAQSVLASAHSLVEALPATLIAGGGWVSVVTTINVSMQMRSPETILGRCLSIYQAVTFGGMALGSWTWGAMADWKDLPFSLHSASGFMLVSFVLLRIFAPMPQPHEGRIE